MFAGVESQHNEHFDVHQLTGSLFFLPFNNTTEVCFWPLAQPEAAVSSLSDLHDCSERICHSESCVLVSILETLNRVSLHTVTGSLQC